MTLARDVYVKRKTGRVMSGQFIVALMLFGIVVGFTANLWLHALRQIEFRKIANFYRIGFLGLATSLAILVWVQAFALLGANIGNALFQGVTAAFILFVIFAWGRLTVIGLKFETTHLT